MMWPRKRRFRRGQEAGKLSAGLHHSPGFELVLEEFSKQGPSAVLDLGASSTENLEALAHLTDDLLIQDCFHKAGAVPGGRAGIFDFGEASAVELPDRSEDFELILLWDLLHYFTRIEAMRFAARVVERLAPGGLILIHASAVVPVPPAPIHFRIADGGRLDYELDDARVPSPALPIRAVEKMLSACIPLRIFQLRNGLQELVLKRRQETPDS